MSAEAFLDTSAAFAFLSADDDRHASASAAFRRLMEGRARLVTTSYVLVETYALLSARLGMPAAAAFRQRFAPLCEIVWVDAALHDGGLERWLGRGSKSLSLVDCVSFSVMRARGITTAFACDADFVAAGFQLA